VATLIAEIAAASKEQSQGIDQVNTAVAEMDKVVQNNAANAEESASASEELSSQAQELNAMVSQLVTIVGGSGQDGNGRLRLEATTSYEKQKVSSAAGKKDEAHHLKDDVHKLLHTQEKGGAKSKAKPVKPEEVIPLDDKELKEF
jgi:methyl-accepting chemotaxis protein